MLYTKVTKKFNAILKNDDDSFSLYLKNSYMDYKFSNYSWGKDDICINGEPNRFKLKLYDRFFKEVDYTIDYDKKAILCNSDKIVTRIVFEFNNKNSLVITRQHEGKGHIEYIGFKDDFVGFECESFGGQNFEFCKVANRQRSFRGADDEYLEQQQFYTKQPTTWGETHIKRNTIKNLFLVTLYGAGYFNNRDFIIETKGEFVARYMASELEKAERLGKINRIKCPNFNIGERVYLNNIVIRRFNEEELIALTKDNKLVYKINSDYGIRVDIEKDNYRKDEVKVLNVSVVELDSQNTDMLLEIDTSDNTEYGDWCL